MNTTVAATNAERAEIPQFHGRHHVGFRPAIWISPPPQLDFRHIGALMVVSPPGTSIVNLLRESSDFRSTFTVGAELSNVPAQAVLSMR